MSAKQATSEAAAPPVPERTKKPPTRVVTKAPARLPMSESIPILKNDTSSVNLTRVNTPRQNDVLVVPRSSISQVATNHRREFGKARTSSVRGLTPSDEQRNTKSGTALATVHGRPIPSGTNRELRLSPSKFVSPSSASVADQIVPLTRWPIRQRTSNSPPDGTIISNLRTRRGNEYVDSPSHLVSLTNKPTALTSDDEGLPDLFLPNGPGVNLQDCRHDVSPLGYTVSMRSESKQSPSKQTDKSSVAVTSVCQEGIVCSRCGRCRCVTCTLRGTEQSELPRLWLGEQECSARTAVEICTCMCCIRGIFYHTRRSDEEDFSEEPCACTEKPACCGRWSAIALLAVTFLPCLVCYLPMRCAVDACTRCYNTRHNNIGCRCQYATQPAGAKGLLTPESESSSY